MKLFLKSIGAIGLGWLSGSAINMIIIFLGNIFFPIDGIKADDMEVLVEKMALLDPEYFIFPFLGHALGTFVGAAVTGIIVLKYRFQLAMVIGVLFLAGGIAMNMLVPSPTWFAVLDLGIAYLPMAWIGGSLGAKIKTIGKS